MITAEMIAHYRVLANVGMDTGNDAMASQWSQTS